jgi:hypothetical protein
VVDADSPEWRNFDDYKEKILRRAKTRALTFIHSVGLRMGGDENDVNDIDPRRILVQALARLLIALTGPQRSEAEQRGPGHPHHLPPRRRPRGSFIAVVFIVVP